MKKTITIATLSAIAVAAGLTAWSLRARAADEPASLKGKPAPEIALKNLDGKDLKLSDFKGKVVVVDNWATWCPPCRESLPHLQKVSADKTLSDKGLVVWAVDIKEDKDTVSKFLKENKYSFNVLMDEKGDMLKNYFISGIPTTMIIGRDGTVKDAFVGYGGEDSAKALDEAINKALADAAPK
jgi:thiol-disulfide isomerase/thioredoxin